MSIFPIYVLADRSSSMLTPAESPAIDVVNQVIRELITELSRDPQICDATRISVVSFATDATIELPLTRLTFTTTCPLLRAEGWTSFAAAFETTATAVRNDLARLGDTQDPMIFMLTDGQPNAERDRKRGWRAEHKALLNSVAGRRVLLVPFGFGNVDEDIIASITSSGNSAYIAARSDSPAQAVMRFGELIFQSIATSIPNDKPRTVGPPGGRIVRGVDY